jgi:hypothetical protein
MPRDSNLVAMASAAKSVIRAALEVRQALGNLLLIHGFRRGKPLVVFNNPVGQLTQFFFKVRRVEGC